ncbi:MAG: NUDIX domain-containing protein [Candidatus Uhrbacteria bacterium]
MRKETSAGAIVFKRTGRGLVFAMVVDGFGKTTFTKGHVRRGERLSEAAVRETCEEIGLCDLKYVARLGRIEIEFIDRFVYKGYLVQKQIHYFLFEAPRKARIKVMSPKKHGERIQRGLWVPAYKLLDTSSYDDLKPLVKKALKIVSRDRQAPRPLGYGQG